MSNSTFLAVTDANFQEQVLQAQGPVLLKFEADWCGPCQAMKPMISDIAAEYAGRLTVATLDIDQNQQTPYKFGVRGVPTVAKALVGLAVARMESRRAEAEKIGPAARVLTMPPSLRAIRTPVH